MRLRSDFWVSAYIRTQELTGGFATLRRRGAAEAGAVFVVLDCGDGRVALFAPGPSNEDLERRFLRAHREEWADAAAVGETLAREIRRDPDVWIVDIERRDGAHGLELSKRARAFAHVGRDRSPMAAWE